MIKVNVFFDDKKLRKRLKESVIAAFVDTVKGLNQPLQDSITSIIWDWPRTTFRKSGEIVSSPRNIVDLGNLRDSQELFFESWTYATYIWDVPYAIYVHEGYITKKGTEVPARPWVLETLDEIDFKEAFINNLHKYL